MANQHGIEIWIKVCPDCKNSDIKKKDGHYVCNKCQTYFELDEVELIKLAGEAKEAE